MDVYMRSLAPFLRSCFKIVPANLQHRLFFLWQNTFRPAYPTLTTAPARLLLSINQSSSLHNSFIPPRMLLLFIHPSLPA